MSEQISSRQLAEEYENDDKNYQGEEMTIRGEITGIDNVISAAMARMHGTGEKYHGTHLRFKMQDRGEAEKLVVGETMVLRGTCQGFEEKGSPSGDSVVWIIFDNTTVVK